MPRRTMTDELFRLEGFVPDKHVAFVLRMLGGKVQHLHCAPVTNAVHKNGKLTAETSGKAADMAMAWLKKRKMQRFTVADIRQFMREIGRSELSAGSVLKDLKPLITRHGKGPAHFYYTLKGK